MVHQYKNNGYDIVLDVNSGAIHVVDDVTYDVIANYEEHSAEEIVEILKDTYSVEEIKEAIDEVKELVDNEELFTEDVYENTIIDSRSALLLLRPYVCILHMTAILPANIVLQKKENIMEDELSWIMRLVSRHWIF